MNKLNTTCTSAVLLGFALATSAVAQQPQGDQFPDERTAKATCESVEWNDNMLSNHSHLIGACQEVVEVDGESWARFDAKFVKIDNDGNVVFSVRDHRDRSVEEVTLEPATGQMAYINNRATPFRQLRTTDSINLYVPEGAYGFATQPDAPSDQLARISTEQETAPVVTDRAVAQRSTERTTQRSELPATASALPWFALAGFLSLLGGMILTMRRWY